MYLYALVAAALFAICESTLQNRLKRSVTADTSRWWEVPKIEYELSSTEYDKEDLATIAAAFKHIEARTCLRFVPRKNGSSSSYLYLGKDEEDPTFCISGLGRELTNKTNLVGLPSRCMYMGIVVHEIMHRLGFIHEHAKNDRSEHVTVLWKNIDSGEHINFKRFKSHDFGLPYDYHSVMHYAQREHRKGNKPTIVPKGEGKTYLLGQRIGLSDLDAKKINLLFRCNTRGGRYQKVLKKALRKLKNKKLPDLAKLPYTSCPNNVVSEKKCQAWLRQGYCGEQQIAAACPRVCGMTNSCRRWAKYGYCHNENKKELLKKICHCACASATNG